MTQQGVWEDIALSWDSFRQKPFPPVINKISREWPKGKLLDIGCGNARNLVPFIKNKFSCSGIDFSKNMVVLAEKLLKKHKLEAKLIQSSSIKIPFKDKTFDYIISVAMLHNLNKWERQKTLNEIKRLLKPNGKALITVWNKWQLKFIFLKKEIFVPWRKKDKILKRYYYLYNYFELKKQLIKMGFKIEHSQGIFDDNLIFIITR